MKDILERNARWPLIGGSMMAAGAALLALAKAVLFLVLKNRSNLKEASTAEYAARSDLEEVSTA